MNEKTEALNNTNSETIALTKKFESREHLINYINKYKRGEAHEVHLKIRNFQFFEWVNGEPEIQELKSENFTKINLMYNTYTQRLSVELFTADNKIFQNLYILKTEFVMIFDIVD